MAVTSTSVNSRQPHWSAAAGKIVYQSDQGGDSEIWVMNADGNGKTQLTSNASADSAPRWSPDGTKIGFATNRDGNSEIYVMNANGTGQTRLTNNPVDDIEPVWSLDGAALAYASNRVSANATTAGADYRMHGLRLADGQVAQIGSVVSGGVNGSDWGQIVVPTPTCDPNNCASLVSPTDAPEQ